MMLCTGQVICGPQVGQRVIAIPYYGCDMTKIPQPGTVVDVNEAHGHYTVLFDVGYRENYRFLDGGCAE